MFQNKKKPHSLSVVIVMFFLLFSLSAPADAAQSKKARKLKSGARIAKLAPTIPTSQKYADLIIEAKTGRILHETNAEAQRHPASLTKMMTLYLAFQAIENGVIRLDTPLPVSAKAAAQSPSKLGLRAGQTIRAYDAIMGLVTESANDAAVVLAEAMAGSTDAFADLMVKQARALGMRRTIFHNPNGLPDPDQVTTARDMAILGYGLIYHYPGFYPYFSKQSFVYKGRTYRNHNHLMERYSGMDGIKTGYIRASGFNLVTSAVRGDTRLIGVIFGGTSAPSRDKQMESLLNQSFENEPRISSTASIPLPSKITVAFSNGVPSGKTVSTTAPSPPEQTATAPTESTQPTHILQLPTQPVVTAPTTGGTGGWGLQVGAYSDIAAAQQALSSMAQTMAPILKQSEQSLQKITMSDGSAMYRARFMGIDQSTARSACAYLVKNGHSCLVVSGP